MAPKAGSGSAVPPGKARGKSKPSEARSGGLLVYVGAVAAALAAVAAAGRWWGFSAQLGGGSPATSGETAPSASRMDVDPDAMTAQGPLLGRLMALLEEVDIFEGEGQQAERVEANRRLETELDSIEAELDVTTAAGKEQASLLAVIRSALKSDRGEGAPDEHTWTDEALEEKHGYVTYASGKYWDDAYADGKYGESFEWFGAWEEKTEGGGPSLAEVVRPVLAKDARILMLGCGNSNMSALMYAEGYERIVNVDISEAVIDRMAKRYAHLTGMEWKAMDASAMEFPDGHFDAVLDKGMFDALFTGTGSKSLPVLTDVRRVLRRGGRLVSMSFGEDRMENFFHQPDGSGRAGLSCKVTSTLKYDSKQAAESSHGGRYWVYSCDQL